MVIRIAVIFLVLLNTELPAQTVNVKCGTFQGVRTRMENRMVKIEGALETRPVLHASILTRNQRIRIHYDTVGSNLPAMVDVSGARIPNSYRRFIDTLRVLLDSVWNTEVGTFDFEPPPQDSGRGGGDEYDFYVVDLGSGYFGQTIFETSYPVGPVKPNRQFTSFIRIDNDFGTGFRTKGIPAMMATTAHEFHHAIQVGTSGVWEDDHFYFYEICAEAMENTVFKDAQDYLFDVKDYFTHLSSYPLFGTWSATTPGYERAIWGIFLMEKFGTVVMKDLWREMKGMRPVLAMNSVLNSYSTTIQREFSDFSYWNYYTAYRADSVRYYPQAKKLPAVSYQQILTANSAVQELNIVTKSFVTSYFKFIKGSDSAFCIVANTNLNDVMNNGDQTATAKISFTSSSSSGFPAISSSIYGSFTANDPQVWSYAAVGFQSLTSCFPNPFNPATSSLLIPLQNIGASVDVVLSVYSASDLDLIYTGPAQYVPFSGMQYAEWKGRDNEGQLVSSGVYLWILTKGSTTVKGKFAVIR